MIRMEVGMGEKTKVMKSFILIETTYLRLGSSL